MITQRKTANAVSGKNVRACESCLRKRARWYCGADDAFLCQSCDARVHSANPLASRHERVRLETASFKFVAVGRQLSSGQNSFSLELPTWHHGLARKARTPRKHPNNKPKEVEGEGENEKKLNVPNSKALVDSIRLVPDMGGDEDASLDGEDEEQQLLYRVPIFDHFAAEICNASSNGTDETETQTYLAENGGLDGFNLAANDMELLEFSADVESLLGTGFDEEMEGLGLIDCKEDQKGNNIGICFGRSNNNNNSRVKVENEVIVVEGTSNILACDDHMETLDWDFSYESPVAAEEEKVAVGGGEMMANISEEGKDQQGIRRSNTSILLRLNYEGVISAWENQGSPWTTGIRPEFNPDDCWPDFMGMFFGGSYTRGGGGCSSNGGREARVSRYREKRRTRLFSKKIRYEVRKLNAEKRPRMKGRFVKRASFVAPAPAVAATFPTNCKPLLQK